MPGIGFGFLALVVLVLMVAPVDIGTSGAAFGQSAPCNPAVQDCP